MTFNTRMLNSYYYQTKRLLHNLPHPPRSQTGLDMGKGQKSNGGMDAIGEAENLSQPTFSETVNR